MADDVQSLMDRIREKSRVITVMQRKRDGEGWSLLSSAVAFQKLHRDRAALQQQLPPLVVV